MNGIIEFETERLHLRQWRAADYGPFAALNADPKVMAFLPAPLDRRASDTLADRIKSEIATRGWGFWAVEERQGGEFIGFVGLHVPGPDLPFSPCVEVGWRLGLDYWGHGYATEAARGALHVGYEVLDLAEIVAFTTLRNIRSRAVMERLGMRLDEARFDHPSLPPTSPIRRHCLYRLSRTQWLPGGTVRIV